MKLTIYSRIKVIFVMTICLISYGCNKNFLDLAPDQDLSEDDVFKEYTNFRKYSDYSYSYTEYFAFHGRLWNALPATMSDEAVNANGATKPMNQGSWINTNTDWPNETDRIWTRMYAGIRRTNMVLERIDEVPNFPTQAIKDRTIGETYFLRAMFYFELIKRYGAIPLVERTLRGEEDLDLPRADYDACIDFVVADCDRAANLLPPTYPDADIGRATKGAALALKSRMLLYAASPLNNPSNEITKWQAAAVAANEVIQLGLYDLYPDAHTLFFQPTCEEVIWNRPRGKVNFDQGLGYNQGGLWVRFIATEGYLGWNGTSVTTNFVELHEANNGYPINDSRSNYDEANPYENRDPRLKINVLTNNVSWLGRSTEFYTGGRDKGSANVNLTGQSMRKFWPDNLIRIAGGNTTYLNYIVFRYAEILLNYAEAMNEAYGPDNNNGYTLTAREAANLVRNRVNQAPIPLDISSSTETMRTRLQNERAVELCFEDHRFYDLLRWKKGTEFLNGPIYGTRITKISDNNFTYERFTVETRVFQQHMHRYPLPLSEIYKSNGILEQNPGWID